MNASRPDQVGTSRSSYRYMPARANRIIGGYEVRIFCFGPGCLLRRSVSDTVECAKSAVGSAERCRVASRGRRAVLPAGAGLLLSRACGITWKRSSTVSAHFVRGNQDYTISLTADEGVLDYSCDCPVGSERYALYVTNIVTAKFSALLFVRTGIFRAQAPDDAGMKSCGCGRCQAGPGREREDSSRPATC